MTEEVTPTLTAKETPDPIAELRKIVNEQNAVILKQQESIKALTERMNESEKVAGAAPAKSEVPAEPEKSPQDRAWEAMMKEMNIKEE